MSGEEEYKVEKIVDMKIESGRGRGTKMYLIKWEDYDDSENTWEPAKQMKQDCPDLVKQFELEHEKKSDRGKTEDEDQTVEAVKATASNSAGPSRRPGRPNKNVNKSAGIKIKLTTPKKESKKRIAKVAKMIIGMKRDPLTNEISVRFSQDKTKFVPLSKAKIDHPQLVIDYLLPLVEFPAIRLERVEMQNQQEAQEDAAAGNGEEMDDEVPMEEGTSETSDESLSQS